MGDAYRTHRFQNDSPIIRIDQGWVSRPFYPVAVFCYPNYRMVICDLLVTVNGG